MQSNQRTTIVATRWAATLVLLIAVVPAACGEEPSRTAPEVQRLFTLLDLDRPDLADVKAAHAAGDFTAAMDALHEHYRKRFPREAIRPKVFNNVKGDADMALEFRFRSRPTNDYYKLHEDFDWYNRPEEIATGHWLSLLVSLHQLNFMADVYLKTGEEKYAQGVQRLFDDWCKHCPPGSGSPSWSLATTMIRSGVLLRVFERMVQWEEWPHDAQARMLANIHDHAEFMAARRGPGNQDATNSEHLMRLATGLPEFRRAEVWLETGYERIRPRIFEDVLEDGTQRELTSGYHLNAVNTYSLAAERMKEFGRPVDAKYRERLEKMYQWCQVMVRPDGSVPVNGDSVGSGVPEYLARGAKLFDRPDMAFVATHGKHGRPPAWLDGELSAAGYYTLRTSWTDPNGVYLFLDASTQPVVSHQDFDALHVNLFAYGRNFLPDKGTYTYGGEYHKAAKATVNHSTIAIDGTNQQDVPAVTEAFHSADAFGYLSATQAGYPLAAHTRQICLIRPAAGVTPYVVLVDRVTGEGKHQVDQFFHLPPGGLQIEADGKVARTDFVEGANLRIESLSFEDLQTDAVQTEMHPRQGKTELRPGVRFRHEKLPAVFVTLLLPHPGTKAPRLQTRLEGAAGIGDTIRVRVDQGDIVDMLSFGPRGEAEAFQFERSSGKENVRITVPARKATPP